MLAQRGPQSLPILLLLLLLLPWCFPIRQVPFEQKESQEQEQQQEGCMSHCTNSGIKIGRKP